MKQILALLLCLFSLQAEVYYSPEMLQNHLKTYTEEEESLVQKDLAIVRSICFSEQIKSERPFYLATAGGPGARKTTILERFMAAHPEYAQCHYLDPDPRTLKFMAHTFYARSLNALELAKNPNYSAIQKQAYEKWRGASNYISLSLMEEAFASRSNIAYGTTSTGDHTEKFLDKVKEAGYEIVLLLCSCEDSLRFDAISYRNNVHRFYQSSPEDAVAKGKFFPQRMPVYLKAADKLYFFWSDSLFESERLAATMEHGELSIVDSQAFFRFRHKYESDRLKLAEEGIEIPTWDALFYD